MTTFNAKLSKLKYYHSTRERFNDVFGNTQRVIVDSVLLVRVSKQMLEMRRPLLSQYNETKLRHRLRLV